MELWPISVGDPRKCNWPLLVAVFSYLVFSVDVTRDYLKCKQEIKVFQFYS